MVEEEGYEEDDENILEGDEIVETGNDSVVNNDD